MGTTYDLIKIDKGETYDLGKKLGSVFPLDVVFKIHDLYNNRNEVFNNLLACMEHGWSFETEEDRLSYADFVCTDVYKWCGIDRIVCCANGDYEENIGIFVKNHNALITDYSHFKETGTRYRSE
jgi:hypothetical protein